MRFGRAPAALGLLAVVGLCVAGTASSAATQRVTARTTFVPGSTTCTPPAPKAQNLTVEHCTGGVETWTGDITGTGKYSFDRITNLASGTAILVNGVEVIEAPVFSEPAEVTCTRNGMSTTSVRVLSSSSRASTVEPGPSLAPMDRFESSTSTSASTRASSASRDTASGITTKGPPRRAFLPSHRAASGKGDRGYRKCTQGSRASRSSSAEFGVPLEARRRRECPLRAL